MHDHLKTQVTINFSYKLLSFKELEAVFFLVFIATGMFSFARDHALHEITESYVLVVRGADLS